MQKLFHSIFVADLKILPTSDFKKMIKFSQPDLFLDIYKVNFIWVEKS
jgi:hypothetical protein